METRVPQSLCGICNQRTAIYKCPRCFMGTCSLPCSRSHKTLQSCSGERDKAAYVPMNKYGWGTMVNDYTYLEEVSRKTVEWGSDIVKGGYFSSAAAAARGRGRGRGRGAPRSMGRGKRDVLKMQLDARDIDMEMLPPGMEKRRLNQSTWDVRTKTILLTVELIFHPAKNPLSPSSAPAPPSIRMLTHRNDMNSTLLDLVRENLTDRRKKEALPFWVQSLATNVEADVDPAIYLLAQHAISESHPMSKAYYKLDETQSLVVCFRHKSFVEFPTVDVWEDGAFSGKLVSTDGTIVESEDAPSPTKRRRLDTVGGRRMIKSLLGGYKSDEDQEGENVLSMLGNYGSDQDPEPEDAWPEDPVDEDEEIGDDESEEAKLEDIREIFNAIEDTGSIEDKIAWDEAEDYAVDWCDSGEDEGEDSSKL